MKNEKFYFQTVTRKLNFCFLTSELLIRSWKIKISPRLTNSMVKLSFFHFWVSNSNLKNIKQETLRVVTVALICSTLAALWEFQYFQRPIYNHGTKIRTGTTCKKIPCYMHDSASRWFIAGKANIFWNYVKYFWILAGVRKCRILIGLSK